MRKALHVFCVIVASGCFLYVGAWFLGGQERKAEDSRLAEEFHRPPASAAPSPHASAAEGTARAAVAKPVSEDTPDDRFVKLAAVNPDVVGWITVGGTSIDYPVMRAPDNERYLSTDFQGGDNQRGSIFMDYRCEKDSPNLIIYGHHMKDGTMFHDLARYQQPGFMAEHPDIRFYPSGGGEETYRVVDVLRWDTEEERGETFFEYMTGLDYNGEKLISLATCDNADHSVRIVVVASKAS